MVNTAKYNNNEVELYYEYNIPESSILRPLPIDGSESDYSDLFSDSEEVKIVDENVCGGTEENSDICGFEVHGDEHVME